MKRYKLFFLSSLASLFMGCQDDLERQYNAIEEAIEEEIVSEDFELINPGFELDGQEVEDPQGWTKWSPPSKPSSFANAKVVKGDAHSGEYYLEMSGDSDYDINVNQKIASIPNGKYTLSAWYRSSGGQQYAIVSIKDYGGDEIVRNVNQAKDEWTEVVIEEVEITNGKCQIDLYSGASTPEQWLNFDDISLTKIEEEDLIEPEGDFRLLWFDEFNGTGAPDATKWNYELGYIRNEELQWYTNSLSNVKQNNGNLELTIIKENSNGKEYTSGSIVTRDKFHFTYGKIEGRFKMPNGKGLWPCFWTLGVNENPIGWPHCGEIDIFEHINSEEQVHGTAHWADAGKQHISRGETFEVNVEEWHVYSIEWTPQSIKWFVDGNLYNTVKIEGGNNSTDEFHKPHYLLINFPIGGSWPGDPDDTTPLPATMYCDWVRYYEWVGEGNIPISKITLNSESLNLLETKTYQLSADIIPANAVNKELVWESSNPSVATVDNNGLVTGISQGEAVITATAKDGSAVSAVCNIVVEAINYDYNYLLNNSFELDGVLNNATKLTNWDIWINGQGESPVQIVSGDAKDGSFYLKYSKEINYDDTYVMQTVTGLPSGNYELKGWYRCSGGQGWAAIVEQGHGYNFHQFVQNNVWTEFTVNINNVNDGQIKIEMFCGNSSAGQWIDIDDLSLKLKE